MKLLKRTYQLSTEQVSLIKTTICKGASDEELRLFLWVAKRHRLDPLTRQLHAVKRHVTKHHQDEKGIWVPGDQMTIQIGIDGYRAMAARYKDYGAVDEPEYEFDKPGDKIPTMARVRLWKKGLEHPTVGIAFWDEYAPADLNADKAFMWKKMPKLMLAKCAEALALRKGYPDLADIYVDEEMHQADVDYSPEGRQIVTEDGTSPSGRPVTWEAHQAAKLPEVTPGVPRTGSHAAAQEVLKQKLGAAKTGEGEKSVAGDGVSPSTAPSVPPAQKVEPWKFAGSITLDLTKPGDVVVTGDVQELFAAAPQCMSMFKWGADGFWYVKLADTAFIRKCCVEINFEIREIRPAKSSAPQRHEGGKTTVHGEGSGRKPEKAGTATPSVVAGTIERTNMGMAGKSPVKYITLLTAGKKKVFLGCFHKSMWDDIEAGLGKLASFVVVTKGEYTNIERIRQIGSKEWLEDGTPVIQRDREPGKTLFP